MFRMPFYTGETYKKDCYPLQGRLGYSASGKLNGRGFTIEKYVGEILPNAVGSASFVLLLF